MQEAQAFLLSFYRALHPARLWRRKAFCLVHRQENDWEKRPHLWTYSFVEVSGHNLESSQTWGFRMGFLNHWEGFLSGFPPFSYTEYSNWTVETVRGCVSLKKYKSQGKAVEVTVNSKKKRKVGDTLACRRGGGGPNPDDWRKNLVLCLTLWVASLYQIEHFFT